MDKLLLHFSVLTLFIGLINKCVVDGECQHPCVGGHICNSKQFLGTCYYLYNDRRRNWYESHQFCAAQKLSMVKFTKEMLDKQFSINDILNPLTNETWLGGRAIDLGKWVFLNNAVANKTDLYLSGISEDQYHGACGNIHISGPNLAFGVNDCTTISQYFICRYAHCEGIADCLKLHRENLNWFEARSNCIDSGAELFYLKDNETLNSVLTTESEIYESIKEHNMFVHVGLRHQRWEWIDGTEIRYTNWDSNGPDKVDENCLLLNGVTGKWSDHNCFEKQLAFCEGAAIEKREDTTKRSTSLQESNEGGVTPPSTSSAISYSTSPRQTSSNKSISESNDVMAVQWKVITIALGSLLGVFFLITLALVIFLFCRKCRNKSTDDDAEFIENNYYDSSSEPIQRTPVAAPSNSIYTNSETVAETLSSHHRTVPETNGATAQSNEKPRIWPKPIFGPKTGDVYSSVEKVNKSPLRPFKSAEYVNTT